MLKSSFIAKTALTLAVIVCIAGAFYFGFKAGATVQFEIDRQKVMQHFREYH